MGGKSERAKERREREGEGERKKRDWGIYTLAELLVALVARKWVHTREKQAWEVRKGTN